MNKTVTNYDTNAAYPKAKAFVLWREVVMAYAAPAIMAGIGGLVTADKGLQFGALTTIGGTSALVALLLGLWLRIRGVRKKWIIRAPHLIVVAIFALASTSFGLLAAWFTSDYLDFIIPINHMGWVSRVWIDFPLSAWIASIIVTWRWRLSVKKNENPKENE